MLFCNVPGIQGAIKGSMRLHWTREAACLEGEEWVSPAGVSWKHLDAIMSIGQVDQSPNLRSVMSLIVRGILLPLLPLPQPPAAPPTVGPSR
jgi:hypothetical protein